MKIAFVNPPQSVPETMYIQMVRRQYTRSAQILPNLSTAYLASYLEKKGFQVHYIDAFAERLSVNETAFRLKSFGASTVCLNLITENFLDTLGWIESLKKLISIPVIVGGLHMSLYPRETLTHQCIDYGVVGDGWETLPELLCAIDSGEKDIHKIKSIVFRRDGAVVETEARGDDIELDSVPFPARHLLPNEKYRAVMSKRRPITLMISSRGCPFDCLYCDVGSIKFEMRAADSVVDEMRDCVKRFGIREIWFQDETFTFEKSRVQEICERLLREDIKVSWSIRTRADLVDKEMLKLMKKAGCFKIHYGIESGDQEVLKTLNRPIPLEVIEEAVRASREEGISVLGFFMIGNPMETEEGIKKSMALAKRLRCDFIQVNKLTPCPPSQLYNMVVKKSGRDFWREYTLGNRGAIKEMGSYISPLSNEKLDLWQKRFFQGFYYRPGYILQRLCDLRSFRELSGLVSSAWSIR